MTQENGKENIRVLIGEDSQFISKIVADHLGQDPSIEVVGTARDGQEVLKSVAALRPDCVTLDLDMPKMNGLETLRYIMSEWPTPVVILSACSERAALYCASPVDWTAPIFSKCFAAARNCLAALLNSPRLCIAAATFRVAPAML